MRFRTLEIRWHDSKPISTCDFQPVSYKKARPGVGHEKAYTTQAYRLASGGEDNHVRIWMVHPYLRPPNIVGEDAAAVPRQPRVEYLATLSRHSAAVNVVRFSPNGELIASAGDDGMIIIWAPSSSPQASTYGSDLSPEDLQHEKEYWKPRTTFRCTTMQVYDLAWSPTGEYIIAGSTDNTARVFAAVDGKCVYEIAEHSHYVQGVAWDPLNEYIATQSSDRSMHVYSISSKPGGAFEAHAVGKNTRMPQSRSRRHSRTPSAHGGHGTSKPRMFRRESNTSDVDSAVFDLGKDVEDAQSSTSPLTSGYGGKDAIIPLTPTTSVGSTPSAAFMFPPPPIEASSRRSSFSGASNPPGLGSPSTFSTSSRYGRSPSPMPALPAIRSLPSSSSSAAVLSWSNAKLYGDESWTNFFRRLTFSPDGGLLLTPAGQFEDPAVVPGLPGSPVKMGAMDDSLTPSRGRKGHPSTLSSTAAAEPVASPSSTSSVYIYSRANFARPPIAQLPGHKKASVAVRFSPILYELRPGVTTVTDELEESKGQATPNATLEKGVAGQIDVDVVGPLSGTAEQLISNFRGGSGTSFNSGSSSLITQRAPIHPIATPSPRPAVLTSGIGLSFLSGASPISSPVDIRPPTPAASKPPTPMILPPAEMSAGANVVVPTASIFALPYRMLFAVVTMDTVAIYDTQQAGPVCMLTKLHYDEFTDLTWSPDGQCLILSSRDGYCTLIVFDEILPAYHTQQHTLQLQSIAHHHSLPISYPTNSNTSSGAGNPSFTSHHPVSSNSHHSSGSLSSQVTPAATPISVNANLPPFILTTPMAAVPKKRHEPPLTPAASADGSEGGVAYMTPQQSQSVEGGREIEAEGRDKIQEPPKKKRRVALTRVGDLES